MKFVTMAFMLLLIVLVRSSEYLKYPSLFSTCAIVISLVIFWCLNFFSVGLQNLKLVSAFDWGNALPLVSSQVYSIESVGTLLTIRQAMLNPRKINLIVKIVFFVSLALFLLNGWSFQLTYIEPVEIAFDYFQASNVLVHILKFCFYLTLPATICITMFTLFTIFESYSPFKNLLGVEDQSNEHSDSRDWSLNLEKIIEEGINSKSESLQRKPKQKIGFIKIAGVRLLFGCILFFPFLLNINEYFLILLTGSLISPCLGFIFPVIAYNYCFRKELRENKFKKYFNYFVLVLGVALNLASFIDTLQQNN